MYETWFDIDVILYWHLFVIDIFDKILIWINIRMFMYISISTYRCDVWCFDIRYRCPFLLHLYQYINIDISMLMYWYWYSNIDGPEKICLKFSGYILKYHLYTRSKQVLMWSQEILPLLLIVHISKKRLIAYKKTLFRA